MARTVERAEIVGMLQRAAAHEGVGYERFVALGRSGELENPRLRDLWAHMG